MPNFGLDQRKPRKKINRTFKKPIHEYIKKNQIIIIGVGFISNLFKIFDSKYSVSSKVIF
jgi:hypothetical protein